MDSERVAAADSKNIVSEENLNENVVNHNKLSIVSGLSLVKEDSHEAGMSSERVAAAEPKNNVSGETLDNNVVNKTELSILSGARK